MNETLEEAISRWHASVNAADLSSAVSAVSDPIVVLGPKGAGSIASRDFANWIIRSGITLTQRSAHLISDCLMVVEQDASWPENPGPVRVATMFRVKNNKVSAALRFSDVKTALEFAWMYKAMSETE
jgi:hypothetical protein